MQVAAPGNGDAQIPGLHIQRVVGNEAEGRAAQFLGVDAQNQVVHCGVAHHHQFHHIRRGNPRVGAGFGDQFVQPIDNRPVHALGPVRVDHRIADPAHQVFAVRHLRVHPAGGGEDFACAQMAEMAGDGRRAHIEGHPVDFVVEAGLHPHHFPSFKNRHRQRPFARGQGRLQAGQNGRVYAHIFQPVDSAQFVGQPLPVAPVIFQFSGGQFHVIETHGRVDGNRPLHAGGLAHHLLAGLALLRHADDQIAGHVAGAAEPGAVGKVAFTGVFHLPLAGGRQVIRLGAQAEFGEVALLHQHFALAAGLVAAADGFDLHAQAAGCFQESRARGHIPLPAGRLEDNAGGCSLGFR